jgi:hypothetical protein
MPEPSSIDVDNELQSRDGLNKNLDQSPPRGRVVSTVRAARGRELLFAGGKEEFHMKRREFTKVMGAVAAGLAAGSALAANAKADEKAEKASCRGHNDCSGKGGCGSGDKGCAGKNTCKGKGGCGSEAARKAGKGKNDCSGKGGCKSGDKGCAGKNSCKGKGGCAAAPAAAK